MKTPWLGGRRKKKMFSSKIRRNQNQRFSSLARAEYWATSRKVKKNKLLDTTHLGGAMNGSHGRTLEQLHKAVNDRV